MDIRKIDRMMELDYALAKLCFSNANIKGHSKQKILKILNKLYDTQVDNINEIDELREKISGIVDTKSRNDGDELPKSSKITMLKNNLPILLSNKKINEYVDLDKYLDSRVGSGSWFNDGERFISHFIISKQRKNLVENKNKVSLVNKINSVSRNETKVSMDYLANTSKKEDYDNVLVEESDIIKNIAPRITNCMNCKHYNLLILNYNEKNEIANALGSKYSEVGLNVLKYAIELVQIKKIYEQYIKDMQNPYRQSYFTPSFEDLLKAATAIMITLPDILLVSSYDTSKEAKNIRKITTLCKTKEYFKCYEIVFQAFQSYYNNLDDDRKGKIQLDFNNNLNNKYSLLSLTRFEIITPQRLISKVNIKIAEKMRNNADYYGNKMESRISVDIIKATQYMDIKSIAGIYNEIKRGTAIDFNLYKDKDVSQDEDYDRYKFMETLQYNFARAILAKISNKKLLVAQEKEMLIDICREYFFEEAFDILIDEESIKKRSRIIASEKRVEKRIYGIDKFNMTLDLALNVYSEYFK